MPRQPDFCSYYRSLRDGHRGLADDVQKLIDELIEALEDILVGPYLEVFRRGLAEARTPAEKLAAVEAAIAKISRDIERLREAVFGAGFAGAPVDFWPDRADPLLGQLMALLRALIYLRMAEAEFDKLVEHWCR